MDKDKTPGQRHAEFAQEVVALARLHGMDNITVKFRTNFHTSDSGYAGTVTAIWAEGRHGDKASIGLQFDGYTGVSEKGVCP